MGSAIAKDESIAKVKETDEGKISKNCEQMDRNMKAYQEAQRKMEQKLNEFRLVREEVQSFENLWEKTEYDVRDKCEEWEQLSIDNVERNANEMNEELKKMDHGLLEKAQSFVNLWVDRYSKELIEGFKEMDHVLNKIQARKEANQKSHCKLDIQNCSKSIIANQKENNGLVSRLREKMERPEKGVHFTGSELLELSDSLEKFEKELVERNKWSYQKASMEDDELAMLLLHIQINKEIHEIVENLASMFSGNSPKQKNEGSNRNVLDCVDSMNEFHIKNLKGLFCEYEETSEEILTEGKTQKLFIRLAHVLVFALVHIKLGVSDKRTDEEIGQALRWIFLCTIVLKKIDDNEQLEEIEACFKGAEKGFMEKLRQIIF
ncbi:unnamed protein product [Caenorhabditis nigoni]